MLTSSLLLFSLALHGVIYWALFRGSVSQSEASMLAGAGADDSEQPRRESAAEVRAKLRADKTGQELSRIKQLSADTRDKKLAKYQKNILFEAGLLSEAQRKNWGRRYRIAPAVAGGFIAVVAAPLYGVDFYGVDFYGADLTQGVIWGIALGYGFTALYLTLELLQRRALRLSALSFYLRIFLYQCLAAVKAEGGAAQGFERLIGIAQQSAKTDPQKESVVNANPVLEMLVLAGNPKNSAFASRLSGLGRYSGHSGLRHTLTQLSRIDQIPASYSRVLVDLAQAAAQDRRSFHSLDLSVAQRLRLANLPLNENSWWALQLAWLGVVTLVIGLQGPLIMKIATILIIAVIPNFILAFVASARVQLKRVELRHLLQLLRGLLVTGLEPISALTEIGTQLGKNDRGSYIAKEISMLWQEMKSGKPPEQALAGFCSSLPLPEVELLRTALILSTTDGGELGPVLEQLTAVLAD